MTRTVQILFVCLVVSVMGLTSAPTVLGWGNGPRGNATTDDPSECDSPPYATHDWIADHAVALLPDEEKAWLTPHMTSYLLGTEAPDNKKIPASCAAPNTGYDDRNKGHSIKWNSDWTAMEVDRAASRAQEEYDKAGRAFQQGDRQDAAFYLGAMAHYVGDVSAYPHSIPNEQHHGDYENRVKRRTRSFDAGHYESYISGDNLVRRRAYTAVKRISKVTGKGRGKVLSAADMDAKYSTQGQDYTDSIGHSLNLAVNELADVLHTFYLNVVNEDG